MSKRHKTYNEEERLSILRDYYHSGMSLGACVRKYSLCGNALLLKWIGKYESHPEIVSLQSECEELDMANRDKDSYKEEIVQLKKRIKELEKALAFSQLETQARDLLIDKAESYFLIPIRKKSGAK